MSHFGISKNDNIILPNKKIVKYTHRTNKVIKFDDNKTYKIEPHKEIYEFLRDDTIPEKHGLLIIGLGGNNGSTLMASVIANKKKLQWEDKTGIKYANYYGSLTQSSTIRVGIDNKTKQHVHIPFSKLVPLVDPNHLVIHGWDISSSNLFQACQNAQVLEKPLLDQLKTDLENIQPWPGIYLPTFIAQNQTSRANHLIESKSTVLDYVREIGKNIRQFKEENKLDKVTILWSGTTERYIDESTEYHQNSDKLLQYIEKKESILEQNISPSQIYCMAAILEKCTFLNGSPQNTFSPAIIDLAFEYDAFLGGRDFKSGQTKFKSVIVDFLISAGFKVESIVSYNHLGNNDGKNLSEDLQFKSKEISKSDVVLDMVQSNHILYEPETHPDHTVVIKYVPFVKDSKRAMDEYITTIFMNGRQTISTYNICEDSLLAVPLMLDMVLMAEWMTRIKYREPNTFKQFQPFGPVLPILSYWFKAPETNQESDPVINALFKQHRAITNFAMAVLGLNLDHDLPLEFF